MEIEDIKGIGPKLGSRLRELQIDTVPKLSVMSPRELGNLAGITIKKANEIIRQAQEASLEQFEVLSAQEILEYRQQLPKISTGSTKLDEILGGGIWMDSVTNLTGEYASGKTQIAHQVAVNCVKLGRRVAWIETEPQTFIPERLLQIAKAQGVELNLSKDFFVIPARMISSPAHQFNAYLAIEKRIERGENIGLIVVDSFSAMFRKAYGGREDLPDRSRDEGRHLGYLQYLASKYQLAVILTVQVMGIPDASMQLGVKKKTGINKQFVGGHILGHSATYWVALDQISSVDKTWKAIVFDGPVERRECIFMIDNTGVRDAHGKL